MSDIRDFIRESRALRRRERLALFLIGLSFVSVIFAAGWCGCHA